jgi:hypothetical protein
MVILTKILKRDLRTGLKKAPRQSPEKITMRALRAAWE